MLDVNNIYVNAKNHKFDPRIFIEAIPVEYVKEIHLAGHTVKQFEDGEILIDTHNKRVTDDVWTLYQETMQRVGNVPVLIEWDTDIPALSVLLDEADKAQRILDLIRSSGERRGEHHERIA